MSSTAGPTGSGGTVRAGPSATTGEADGRLPRLSITDVRLVALRTVRVVGSLEPAWHPGGRKTFRVGGGAYLEIHTDQGLIGIGPGIDPSLLPIVSQQLVGRDPFDVEGHMGRIRYHGGHRAGSGTAGVDIALWDLIGKAAGRPLYELWGGVKASVPVYASTVALSGPERAVRLVAELVEEGWLAVKLRLHHQTVAEDVATVEAVRAELGDRVTIMADANQAQSPGDWQPGVRWDLERAVTTARELERLHVEWLEEPLARYAFAELTELARRVELPIAGGENNAGVHEFAWMIERGVYDILQPDCLVAGGITELRRIGGLAEASPRPIVPHHGGGGLGTIAHLHLVASWPHAPWLELLHEPPVGSYRHRFAMFRDPPAVDATGHMAVPRGPGLGVEIDPDLIADP